MAYIVSNEAEAELDEIWLYIAQSSQDIDVAERLIDAIVDRFYRLSIHPHLGRSRHEDLLPQLRSFAVGEYVILYRIHHEDILILHVYRGSRDIPSILRP